MCRGVQQHYPGGGIVFLLEESTAGAEGRGRTFDITEDIVKDSLRTAIIMNNQVSIIEHFNTIDFK